MTLAVRPSTAFLVFLLLYCTDAARAELWQANPDSLVGILSRVSPGEDVQLAPGKYDVPDLPLPSVRFAATGGEVIWRVPDAGWQVEGETALEGITFWSPSTNRADTVFRMLPGSQLSFGNCHFSNLAGEPVISGEDASLTLENCTFFRSPRALRMEGVEGARLTVTGCEFVALPQPDTAFLHLRGNVAAEVQGQFSGGGLALLAEGPTESLRIVHSTFSGSFAGALRATNASGPIELIGCHLRGGFTGSAVSISGNGSLRIEELEARAVQLQSADAALVDIEGLRFLDARQVNFSGRGAGCGIRIAGRDSDVTMHAITLGGWSRGLEVQGLRAEIEGVEIQNCDVGLSASDATLDLREGLVTSNRVGIVLTDTTTARVSAQVSASLEIGVLIESGASMTLRDARVRKNALGVLIEDGAGLVDLGTEDFPGGNEFQVSVPTAFAIRNNFSTSVPALGNRWYQADLEILGHVAIDDLCDDGDKDNPIGESGRESVRVEVRGDFEGSTIRWDSSSDRRTLGYGNTVFRSREEVEARVGRVRTVLLGAGEYPPLTTLPARLVMKGQGAERTRIVARAPGHAAIESNVRQLTLEELSLQFEPGGPETAISWTGGELKLAGVHIENYPEAGLTAMPGVGAVEMRHVDFRLPSTAARPIWLRGRSTVLHNVLIHTQSQEPALDWVGSPTRTLSAEGVEIHTGAAADSAMRITGNATLRRIRINQASGAGLILTSDSPSIQFDVEDLRLSGFSRVGISLEGHFDQAVLRTISLRPGLNPTVVSAGIHYAQEASGSLSIENLDATNVRPGLAIHGSWKEGTAHGIRLRLDSAHNSLDRQEDGITFSSSGRTTGQFTITGAEIEGYDSGIHLTADHDNDTTITLGNYLGTGSNRLVRNSVGIRLSSPRGTLVVKEDRNRARIAENGVGVLVEAGNLKLENARIVENSAGVIVRGGTADLGGGPFASRGGNLLWPQSGSFAIINETPESVMARGNYWEEAEELLPTEARPIRDSAQDPNAGPVVTSDNQAPTP